MAQQQAVSRSAVLAERGLIKGDACLVPEPTSLSVCVAERGLLVADVIIRGRPGHGSRPRSRRIASQSRPATNSIA